MSQATPPAAMSDPVQSPAASAPPPIAVAPDAAALPAPLPAYDLFVVHAPGDLAFVRGYLLPSLDLPEQRVRVAGERPPEAEELPELQRALERCSVFLVVLTPAFLADPWAQLAEQWAAHAAAGAERAVIPLVLQTCEIPLHLDANVHLDLRRPEEWEEEITRLRQLFDQPPPLEPVLPCPYPGMRPFQTGDAAHFHGREREIGELVAHLRAGKRELHLVGPSGSGKSSLVFAGLLPRLASAGSRLVVRSFRPGEAPVQRLLGALGVPGAPAALASSANAAAAAPTAAALAAAVTSLLAATPGAERLLLVVDQLEELLTLAPAAEQLRFAAAIAALRAEPRCVLLFTLRADFFAELMQSPLWREGGVTHVDVAPLRGDGLRAAIEQPARDARVFLEPALVERLLADAESPGALPLIQETLLQLWEHHRRRRLLPLAAYLALGDGERSGFAVAISRRADRCLAELSPAQQRIARRVFLRLISFGEGRPDTRRQQPASALRGGESPGELAAVLTALAKDRLISLDAGVPSSGAIAGATDDRIDLAHEALITAWPPLTEWVKVRRADEERRRQLELRATEWIALGRGTGGLLDEEELTAARVWRRSQAIAELGESPELAALFTASSREVDRVRRRRARRIAITIAGLAALALVAIVLALYARHQTNDAVTQRQAAEEQRTAAVKLLGASYQETGRQVLLDGRPRDAAPYFVAAREQGLDTPALRMLFHQATANPLLATFQHDNLIQAYDLTSDEQLLLTGSRDRTAKLWDVATGGLRFTWPHPAGILVVGFRDHETTAVTATEEGLVSFWDLRTGAPHAAPRRVPADYDYWRGLLSPDGRWLMLQAHGRGLVFLDLDDPASQPRLLASDAQIRSVSFAPDGQHLVTVDSEEVAMVWRTSSGEALWRLGAPAEHPLDAPAEPIDFEQATFTGDGKRIVTLEGTRTMQVWSLEWKSRDMGISADHRDVLGIEPNAGGNLFASYGKDGTARVWNTLGHEVSPVLRHGATVASASFSKDGERLATASLDQTVQIWGTSSGLPLTPSLQHPSTVMFVHFMTDDTRVLTLAGDNAMRLWDARTHVQRTYGQMSLGSSPALSPDWTLLAAIAEDEVKLWDARTGAPRGQLARPRDLYARCVAFSPDGTRLFTGDSDGAARIWDVATGELIGQPLEHGSFPVLALAVSRDGTRLATVSEEGRLSSDKRGTARVWDLRTGEPLTPLLEDRDAQRLKLVELSPDGATLLTGGDGEAARLWRLPDGEVIARLAHGVLLSSAHFSPDGRTILTSGQDGAATLWDAATGAQRRTFPHRDALFGARFDREGARLLTYGHGNTVELHDTATGRLLIPPLSHRTGVIEAMLTPDGSRIITTSQDFLIRVWDAATGTLLLALESEDSSLSAISVSPDSNQLLTASGSEALQLWDIATDPGTLEEWKAHLAQGRYPALPTGGAPGPAAPRR